MQNPFGTILPKTANSTVKHVTSGLVGYYKLTGYRPTMDSFSYIINYFLKKNYIVNYIYSVLWCTIRNFTQFLLNTHVRRLFYSLKLNPWNVKRS